jgi:hypothetical protein
MRGRRSLWQGDKNLGASPAEYQAYAQNIRREYAWVPEPVHLCAERHGRRGLNRPSATGWPSRRPQGQSAKHLVNLAQRFLARGPGAFDRASLAWISLHCTHTFCARLVVSLTDFGGL